MQLSIDVRAIQLRSDREGLELVLRNLLQNAPKFSPDAQPPHISITARTHAERVTLLVAHNGVGFDMQYHEQIFKLFHRLIAKMNSQVPALDLRSCAKRSSAWVASSTLDEGVTFNVELPRQINAQRTTSS